MMIFLLSRFVNDDFNNTDTISFNNFSDTPTVVMSTVNPTSNPTIKPTVKPTSKPVVRIRPRVDIRTRPIQGPDETISQYLAKKEAERARMNAIISKRNILRNGKPIQSHKSIQRPITRKIPITRESHKSKQIPITRKSHKSKQRPITTHPMNQSFNHWIYNMDNGFYKSWKNVTNDNTKKANIHVPSGQYLLAICITAHVSYIISCHSIETQCI